MYIHVYMCIYTYLYIYIYIYIYIYVGVRNRLLTFLVKKGTRYVGAKLSFGLPPQALSDPSLNRICVIEAFYFFPKKKASFSSSFVFLPFDQK